MKAITYLRAMRNRLYCFWRRALFVMIFLFLGGVFLTVVFQDTFALLVPRKSLSPLVTPTDIVVSLSTSTPTSIPQPTNTPSPPSPLATPTDIVIVLPTSTPAPTPQPTNTPSPPSPLATPTDIVIVLPTSTPAPTPQPTDPPPPPVPTLQPTPTLVPTAVPINTPTPSIADLPLVPVPIRPTPTAVVATITPMPTAAIIVPTIVVTPVVVAVPTQPAPPPRRMFIEGYVCIVEDANRQQCAPEDEPVADAIILYIAHDGQTRQARTNESGKFVISDTVESYLTLVVPAGLHGEVIKAPAPRVDFALRRIAQPFVSVISPVALQGASWILVVALLALIGFILWREMRRIYGALQVIQFIVLRQLFLTQAGMTAADAVSTMRHTLTISGVRVPDDLVDIFFASIDTDQPLFYLTGSHVRLAFMTSSRASAYQPDPPWRVQRRHHLSSLESILINLLWSVVLRERLGTNVIINVSRWVVVQEHD